MTTTRWLIRAALLCTLLFGAQARFLNHLPGDVPVNSSVKSQVRSTERSKLPLMQAQAEALTPAGVSEVSSQTCE